MERITQKDLEYLVNRINEITGSPRAPYNTGDKARLKANIGHYYLDYAYGGVSLVRMVNEGGGVTTISRPCHVPKRELYYWMNAFLAGIAVKN